MNGIARAINRGEWSAYVVKCWRDLMDVSGLTRERVYK